jgi:hypothetical protein
MRVVVFAAASMRMTPSNVANNATRLNDAALGDAQVAGETLGDRGGKASVDEDQCGLQRVAAAKHDLHASPSLRSSARRSPCVQPATA